MVHVVMQYKAPPHLHWLHAVDLGKRKVGVASALVSPDGVGRMVFGETLELPGPWTAAAMARVVDEYFDSFTTQIPEVRVCEWPQKYDVKTLYHDDLEDLYAVGNALARLRGGWDKKWRPAQWKGNVPKSAHHRRIVRVITPAEEENLRQHLSTRGRPDGWLDSQDAHDLLDARGILMFALGRVRRGGRLP